MYKAFRIGCLVALLFLLAGCAGKDFIRPTSDTFQLGRTSYSQVVPKKVGYDNERRPYATTGWRRPAAQGVSPVN